MKSEHEDLTETVDLVGDVFDFHEKFGLSYDGKPRILPKDLREFRVKFLREELEEYEKAVCLAEYDVDVRPQLVGAHLEEMLDALVDLVYVAIGTAQYHGFNFREAWRRVQEANMKKVCAMTPTERGGLHDVVKPPGWVAPTHFDLVFDHAHRRTP